MQRANGWSTRVAGLALWCLVSWSVQAEPDKPPCKGKDCASAKIAKTQMANAAKLNKNAIATKKTAVADRGLRSNKSPGANKLLPAVKPGVGNGVGNNALKSAAAGKSAKKPAGSKVKAIGPMS